MHTDQVDQTSKKSESITDQVYCALRDDAVLCQHTPVSVQLPVLKKELLSLWGGTGVEDLRSEVLDRVEPRSHGEAGHSISVTASDVDPHTLRRNTRED